MFTQNYGLVKQAKYLEFLAKTMSVENIANVVLLNPAFPVWAGSSGKRHHGRTRGLIEHTYEVVKLCLNNALLYEGQINTKILYLAALFHDFGKLWDYIMVIDCNGVKMSYSYDVMPEINYDHHFITWEKSPHNREIHHISRSAIEWSKAVEKFPEYKSIEYPVLHCILSHHGLREFGSPVFPKTKEAWLLHLCDGMSARLDDCEILDLVHSK